MPTMWPNWQKAFRYAAAAPRERITLLDDKEYELDPEVLVIADANGAIGLAGIMGGGALPFPTPPPTCCWSQLISDRTPFRDARAAWGFSRTLRKRFERGVDPTLPAIAIERATALLQACVGGAPGPVQVTRGAASANARRAMGAAASRSRDPIAGHARA